MTRAALLSLVLVAAFAPAVAAAEPVHDAKHCRTVLATGDSMIQIVDSFLKQRLSGRRGVRVRTDAHISTGV